MRKSLYSNKDAFIYERQKDDNYGSLDYFIVGRYKEEGTICRALMNFDLSEINILPISKIYLRIYAYCKYCSFKQIITIYKLKDDFQEYQVTWNNSSIIDEKILPIQVLLEFNSGDRYIDIPISKEWVERACNLNIEIRGIENKNATSLSFTTREYSEKSMRPMLIIDYYDECEEIIEQVQSGNFLINSIINIEKGMRGASTFSVENKGTRESSQGLAVLQLSNNDKQDKNKMWSDAQNQVIYPSEKKVFEVNTARKIERVIVISTKVPIVHVAVGGSIDLKKYIQVDTNEGGTTEDYNNQILLKYESTRANICVDDDGNVNLNGIGNVEIKIYTKTGENQNYISIRVCDIIDAIKQGLGNDIYLPSGEIVLPKVPQTTLNGSIKTVIAEDRDLEFILNEDIEIVGEIDSQGKPLTSLSKLIYKIGDNNQHYLTIKNIIFKNINEGAGLNILTIYDAQNSQNVFNDIRIKLENVYFEGNDIGACFTGIQYLELKKCIFEENRIGLLLDKVKYINIEDVDFNCSNNAGLWMQGESSHIFIKANFLRCADQLLDAAGIIIKNADIIHDISISEETTFKGIRKDRWIVEEPSDIAIVYDYEGFIKAYNDNNINTIKFANNIKFQNLLILNRKIIIDGQGFSINVDLYLKVSGIVIKNLKIEESIFIDVGLQGKHDLINGESTKRIAIISVGKDSIYLKGVISPKLYINSDCSIVCDENKDEETVIKTSISEIIMDSNSQQQIISPTLQLYDSIVKSITVQENASGTNMSMNLGTNVQHVILRGKANLNVSDIGTVIEKVQIQGTAINSSIGVKEEAVVRLVELSAQNGNVVASDRGKIDILNVREKGTLIKVITEGQIREINVYTDEVTITGDGAARVIVQPGFQPPRIEGYVEEGDDTAIVSTSIAFYWALDKQNIKTIKMNSSHFPLIDKCLNINKICTVQNNNSKPVITGTIIINVSNVSLKNLCIDARNTYKEELNNYSAILVQSGVSNIEILNNEILQDYNGITILRDCSATIKGNKITAVSQYKYVTNGIQIGDMFKKEQNISAVIEDNEIEGNYYNNIFKYASAVYIKSIGNIIIKGESFNAAIKEESQSLGNALKFNNKIIQNEMIYFIVNPMTLEQEEIWAYNKGLNFYEVKNVNLVNNVDDMRKAIDDSYLGLILTDYNRLFYNKKMKVLEDMIKDRPDHGYYDKLAVQIKLDYLVEKYKGPILLKTIPQNGMNDLPINAEVKAYFESNVTITNKELITITDLQGVSLSNILPYMDSENSKLMIISHADFRENTDYIVSVFSGAVITKYNISNEQDIIWKFKTSTKYKKVIFNDIVQIENGKGTAEIKIDNKDDFTLAVKVLQGDTEIIIGDNIKVEIVDVIPKNNAEKISFDSEVKVTFHRGINSVQQNMVTIIDSDGMEVQGVNAYVDIYDNKNVIITHDNFKPNKGYTVSIPENTLTDEFGIKIDKKIIWTFKTRGQYRIKDLVFKLKNFMLL